MGGGKLGWTLWVTYLLKRVSFVKGAYSWGGHYARSSLSKYYPSEWNGGSSNVDTIDTL